MPLPRPEPGLVIHFEYLWRHEHEAGADQGEKKRPCAIILAVAKGNGTVETVVAPITHRAPTPPSVGIEIPLKVKRHLGLDDDPSWVIVTDLNSFDWPGVDIYPIPRGAPGTFSYGLMPPLFVDRIIAAVNAAGGITSATQREG
jgi:hypothetical protein